MAKPFEFAVHAEGFDSHIENSIPGLSDLPEKHHHHVASLHSAGDQRY